jgi:hypothetical protein
MKLSGSWQILRTTLALLFTKDFDASLFLHYTFNTASTKAIGK